MSVLSCEDSTGARAARPAGAIAHGVSSVLVLAISVERPVARPGAQQQRHDHEARQQRGAALAHKGQGDAGKRDEAWSRRPRW